MKRASILASCILPALSAWAGSPSVGQILPAAGQRGTETEVVLSGGNLADARTLLFDEPGIECTGVSEAAAGKFKAKLKIAANARLGEYAFRAITNSGVGDVRLFYVTPYPVVKEADEVAADPYKAQPAKLGTTIYGASPGEDQDHYEFEAKKGQRISAEVVGIRITTGTLYDAHLTLTKADGKVLAETDDGPFTRQDPVLSVIAPEDGNYRVIVRDATNSGAGACNYLLHLGSHPRPTATYPPGGMAGQTLKLQMLGDAGGPYEQTVKLPDSPVERFEVSAEKDGIQAPQPNFIRVSPFPNVLEAEPNNTAATATATTQPLPLAFNGIVQEPGDVDFFKFTAQKGKAYDVRVHARMLRSPLDSVLTIHNAAGAQTASNDDSGGPDSYVRWSAPADGEFCISVKDQLGRGGPLYSYRVEITAVQPALITYLPEMVQNSSQQRRAIVVPRGNRFASLVQVRRADAAGDSTLDLQGLPPGITATFDKVDKGMDRVPVVFEAKADAAPEQKIFSIFAKLIEPPKDTTVVARVEHRVEVAENGNQQAYYGILERALPIAVAEEVPATITCIQSKVPILQSGSMVLKIAAARKGDFKGPIQVQILYVPTGIGTPGTVTIPEGQTEGTITISANGGAALQTTKTCIIGSVDYGKGTSWISTPLFNLEVAPTFVAGAIQRTYVDQGGEGSITLKLDQKVPFEGKAKVALVGLPQGVTSEEREITKDDTEVKFPIKATATAQPGLHKTLFASFTLVKSGETLTNTIASGGFLRVEKVAAAAKVADAAK